MEPDYTLFLPRRLSHPGCILAGTQLGTQHEALKIDLKGLKVKLSAKVERSIVLVLEASTSLALVPSSDATMTEIDRGTDRGIAGYHDQLDAIERSFHHADLLPLTDEERARLADASLVRSTVLPKGTAFLKDVYRLQWTKMNAMLNALTREDVVAAVERLGLGLETDRLRRWAGLYGAKLGLTEVKQADPSVMGVQAWHDAYGELFAHIHSEYPGRKDELHAKIRTALLSPYMNQAEEERREQQKAKARRTRLDEPGPSDA